MRLTTLINSKKILAGILIATGLSGCEKLIEIPAPVTEMSSELVFSSKQTALSALSGAMSSTTNSLTMAVYMTASTSMAADELRFLANTNYEETENNTYTPLSSTSAVSTLNSLWADLYANIYRFNALLEGVERSTALSDSLKTQIAGNAKFMRGLCYFYLANLYKDVPLILITDVNQTALAPKVTQAAIYEQIITDLVQARDVLPADFSSVPGARTVITKWAASALLARVYLYTEQWALAEAEASKVIDGGGALFAMNTSETLSDVFLRNSREAILQFGSYISPTTGYTYEGMSFASTYTQYSLRPEFMSSFEDGDLRRTDWIRDTTYLGVVNHQPYKFKVITNANGAGRMEAPTPLRLAEQYLIRAEAKLQQERAVEGRDDMNVVRVRAGLEASAATDAATIALQIEEENRHEFFCENGHRWFDLRRTGRINTVLGALKSTWQPRAAYFPLPQVAINANPNLRQNPDYE
ncbi:RagB/SusD family nutrient uptake outer membrane protein [Chitinophaga sp. CF418]|uniref:RagB/SusD family nutrient uptake outer membrane protein n=1 Tax=Chitinophaga sp. CF418 TaxID=1855287 RepID=UPI000914FE99|nr:RagB/SusD family nutrient uptake outer membrane protein [Chitinophaga sp. CF418]SHN36256.1 SusD family protein [Chitinophaga sp. CF418]